ncbi:malto-oligosyltrehalose synthase [Acidicapsa dinghuensis]|uniref:Malto-oligosyltrehalose synthase n=1 Tax=Acidicapsa dinghuensis TaxID=2218256 RepID=A0ABW1EG95_9BACT|nr:malto-oligosyltrehalose synthase [Acidicapsa dinghuensis]
MPRIPTSTYRLQLHGEFTFDDAKAIAPYLKELGISHVYCSPYLQAAPGSTHGYDVVDHEHVNEGLGGEEAHQRFCQRLRELDLGQVLDIVPNHMATGSMNRYWWDVLENGPASRYATWFDIDWQSPEIKLQGKVLIPVLGDQYGRVLAEGNIRIEWDRERFQLRYLDQRFPLSPRSLATVLMRTARQMRDDTLGFLADSLARLPAPDLNDPALVQDRHRDKNAVYGLLKRLCVEKPELMQAIEATLSSINADIDALDEILDQQNYRLAYWRTADQELGYRRFFDINTLVGVRVERQHVFDATHYRIFQWLDQGVLDGVRTDHPDGLRDPQQYFARLRARAPKAWIIGEKILEDGEFLRENWPIDGTSGYDFLNVCNSVLVYDVGLRKLSDIYAEFTGRNESYDAMTHDKKLNVEQEALGSDVNRLANLFVEICEMHRNERDFTRAEIRRAIREVAACFSVYRTYVVAERNEITEEDRREIVSAVTRAKEQRTDIDARLFDFIGDVLMLNERGGRESEFLLRFQQFTSPVMAKGVEDTVFYCFNRMIGLNEVGGSPATNGITLKEFHDYCRHMLATHPLTMVSLTTHDTKRCDDVRARLATLSEIPEKWLAACTRWTRLNEPLKVNRSPDRNTEYFLYQTLVGAWPISEKRLQAYMEKATREAKEQTSWTQQNKEFEEGLRTFLQKLLQSTEFLADLEAFVLEVKEAGQTNSLAQSLLHYTAPGVPDTFQGGELWDFRLLDPDNRSPVDYGMRQSMLNQLKGGLTPEEILERADTGMPKLWLTYKALHLRREHPEWFLAEAEYTPLFATGPKAEHIIAFTRARHVLTLVPRWRLILGDDWARTSFEIPAGRWRNVLTDELVHGGMTSIEELLQRFPVALLVLDSE